MGVQGVVGLGQHVQVGLGLRVAQVVLYGNDDAVPHALLHVGLLALLRIAHEVQLDELLCGGGDLGHVVL